MKKNFKTCLILCTALLLGCAEKTPEVQMYLTTADQSSVFSATPVQFIDDVAADITIEMDPTQRFQTMEGFGAAITGSSCYNLLKMSPENRAKLLYDTFDPTSGMGYSYIRISIGCSDFSLEDYTCCDSAGIENFKIHELDQRDLFPILKEILAINPTVKILASPWTCPRWMKVNNLNEMKPFYSWTSGQLNPNYYQDYATYFVKFIQEMRAEGFNIDAITIQNEPLNRGNSASLFMTWQEQRDFIKTALGPQFKAANIATKIIAYDHNYNYDSWKEDCKDQIGYPAKIYEDAEAAQYIVGSAYHAYGGEKEEMGRIQSLNPEKELYFTEMSIGEWGDGYSFAGDFMWNMREVCLGTINQYCKAIIMWNFMLDDKHAPFRPGGCDICLGAIDIDSNGYEEMTFNSHYYTMAHLSKVIKPGAVRIGNNNASSNDIYYSTFQNPDNSFALVVQNDSSTPKTVAIKNDIKNFSYQLPAKSVVSLMIK